MSASSPATSVEHGPIESIARYPGAPRLTLADLINCARSDSPGMREHAVKIAYALGARDGQVKANEVLEAL